MANHLSVNDLEQYRNKRLRPAELLAVDRHLEACSVCREQLQAMTPTPQLLHEWSPAPELWSEHLAYEQMAAYVDAQLNDIDRDLVEGHAELCQSCALELRQLQTFAEKIAALPTPTPSLWTRLTAWWWVPKYRLAGAVVMLLLLSLVAIPPLLQGTGERIRTAHDTGRQDSPPGAGSVGVPLSGSISEDRAPLSPLPQGSQLSVGETPTVPSPQVGSEAQEPFVHLANKGKPHESVAVTVLPAPYQEMVQAALRAERPEVPSPLRSLRQAEGHAMGELGKGAAFAVLSPRANVVEEDQPTFTWEALAGGLSYTVSIFDASRAEVLTSQPLAGTSWSADRALERGAEYAWQVTARKEGQEIPSLTGRFYILASDAAIEVAQARLHHPEAHLLLGVLYLKAGLLDDAAREIEKLRTVSPDAPEVQKLSRDLQHLQRRSE